MYFLNWVILIFLVKKIKNFIRNFTIINTNEKRITKRVSSCLSFNQIKNYPHCYTYRDYVENYLNDLVLRDDGKFDYKIENTEPMEWEFMCDTGLSLMFKIKKEGFESPVYSIK